MHNVVTMESKMSNWPMQMLWNSHLCFMIVQRQWFRAIPIEVDYYSVTELFVVVMKLFQPVFNILLLKFYWEHGSSCMKSLEWLIITSIPHIPMLFEIRKERRVLVNKLIENSKDEPETVASNMFCTLLETQSGTKTMFASNVNSVDTKFLNLSTPTITGFVAYPYHVQTSSCSYLF